MKKNTKIAPSYFAIATEFSLRSDGRWLTVGGNDFDTLRTASILEAARWMRARMELNLSIELSFDGVPVMHKSAGSAVVELCPASEAEGA